MIKRIEIKNFMSHPHTVIEPAEGLTILVGDNNTGKSAVVNALQVLCNNLSGDYMVRHGAKECLIRVETSEGHELEWRRKGKVVSYRINGRDIHRLGGSVPEDLHQLLRLPRVEAENENFDIHFGEQKNPIFLLNTSPGKRAAFFASSSDTIKLIEMQGLHKKKVQDAKWLEANLLKDEAKLNSRLNKLAPVDEIDGKLAILEVEYKGLEDRLAEIANLQKVMEKLSRARKQAEHWQKSVHVAENLSSPPVFDDSKALTRLIREIERKENDILRNKEQIRILEVLANPPELYDISSLMTHISHLEKTEMDISREEKQCQILETCSLPPEVRDPSDLKELIGKINEIRSKINSLHQAERSLASLGSPPQLEELADLQSILLRMERAEKDCQQRQTELKSSEKELRDTEADLREFVDQTRICPTCGQDLDIDKMLRKSAGSGGGEK